MWKLISIEESPISGKKWRANFYDKVNDKRKHTDFGASGMEDYTMHQDDSRKDRYVKRHMKDLDTGDPTRAGYLSMYILWNKKSIKASIADYKKRFSM